METADERRLARAVRSKQPDALTRLNRQAEIFEGHELAETFRDVARVHGNWAGRVHWRRVVSGSVSVSEKKGRSRERRRETGDRSCRSSGVQELQESRGSRGRRLRRPSVPLCFFGRGGVQRSTFKVWRLAFTGR